MLRALLLAAALAFAPPALAQVMSPADVAGNAINEVIRPGYDLFNENAGALAADFSRLCDAPGADLSKTAREQFAALVTAWGRIEFFRVGPVLEDNRAERILFFPDRKGIALRQVQAILADKDETATDPATLANKSVAVQGLGALEFVLFGTGSEALDTANADFRCRYGKAVAENVASIASDMLDAWLDPDGITRQLTAPAAEDAQYRSTREVLEEIVGQMAFGIEAIRDQRLLPVVGRELFTPKPKSALLWRSGLTMAVIRANLEGIAELALWSRVAAAGEGDTTWLENAIRLEFDGTWDVLDKIHDPIDTALADEAQVRAIDALITRTSSLQTLLGDNIATVLDLSVGFSSLDGD